MESIRAKMIAILEAKKKKRHLNKIEDTIMRDAVASYGAASYLHKRQLAALERDGLIKRKDKHTYTATEYGREVWLKAR